MSSPGELQNIKVFYDSATQKYPEFYKNYLLDNYLKYLISTDLVIQKDGGYVISTFGVGYLVYISERGLTGFRHY